MHNIQSFKCFLNEFELEGEFHGKPLWNGIDYLDGNDIIISYTDIIELPCIFPETWSGSFYCHNNQLTSLKGCPKIIIGNFYCHKNQLISLKDGPIKVGKDFSCDNNLLISLEGAPIEVGKNFDCSRNKKLFTEKEVKQISQVGKNIYV